MISTKIICTIGPACDTKEMLYKLSIAGMNIARLNFSHGSHFSHAKIIKLIRELNKARQFPTAILLDTQGPEIRTGDQELKLVVGENIFINTPPYEEKKGTLFVDYPYLKDDLEIKPHLIFLSPLIRFFVRRLFIHRHRVLKKKFNKV